MGAQNPFTRQPGGQMPPLGMAPPMSGSPFGQQTGVQIPQAAMGGLPAWMQRPPMPNQVMPNQAMPQPGAGMPGQMPTPGFGAPPPSPQWMQQAQQAPNGAGAMAGMPPQASSPQMLARGLMAPRGPAGRF